MLIYIYTNKNKKMQAIKNIFFHFPIKIINISLLWLINNLFKALFLPKTINHYESLWKPMWVIINDNMLKFHDNDIREQTKKELIWD